MDLALSDPQFSTLAQAIVDAGLEETLRGDGPFTVFAPTNDAFDDLGVDLGALDEASLAGILLYHVVAGEVPSTAIPERADSAADLTLFFDLSAGAKVNDANITATDLEASNGLLHVIDAVLLPPNILDAVRYADLTSLAGAVGAADPGVAELLGGTEQLTVFAPTNDAFTAAADITAGLDQAGLTNVLSYHVIPAPVTSDAIPVAAGTGLVNEWGNNVSVLFDTSAGVVVNGSSNVVVADIKTTNGIVHVVDGVLLPPTVVDMAVNGGFTGLLGAVGAASGDLGAVLSGAGPFTVFAPDNAAFTAAEPITSTLGPDELRDVLLYHVVGGAAPVTSGDLSNGSVETLAGASILVDVSSGVLLNGSTNVTVADLNATNGVVHVIDGVLLPPN
ncbi:MAG: fasciclin domain-containing protein [Myxococcota bacterium]